MNYKKDKNSKWIKVPISTDENCTDPCHLFDTSSLVAYDGGVYERMTDHPKNIKYRAILNDDDYDYIKDEELIKKLDTLPTL